MSNTHVFDYYCPTLNRVKHESGQRETERRREIERRICSKYRSIYCPTLVALKDHNRVCRGAVVQEEYESDESDDSEISFDGNFESDEEIVGQ